MRLIDADDFGNRMYHEVFERDSVDQRWDSGCWMRYRLFERILKKQPTIQPERKEGKWMHNKDDELCSGYCSCCGWMAIIMETDVADMPFCPNCGAEMGK